MAKIVSSGLAPDEKVHYVFGGVEFDLDGASDEFDCDDPVVLDNAAAHPWLAVKREQIEAAAPQFTNQIDPKDDPLSAEGSGLDPLSAGQAEAAEAAKAEAAGTRVAIDSGLNQGEKVDTGGVAETLSAAAGTTTDTTGTKS